MEKYCKKCGDIMPENSKHKVCEHCRIEKAKKVRTGLEILGKGVLALGLIVGIGGKFSSKE